MILQRQAMGPLRQNRVSKRQNIVYGEAVCLFLSFMMFYFGRGPISYDELDDFVCTYLESLWMNGDPKALAANTLSGISHFLNRSKILSGGWRLYTTWGRLETVLQATPLDTVTVCAMCGVLIQDNQHQLAFLLALGFAAFLRTAEMLGLRWCDLCFEGSALVLDLGFTKMGKRRNMREYVSIVDPVIVSWARRIQGTGGFIFPRSSYLFRRTFEKVLRVLGFNKGAYLPYSIRRGGATCHWCHHRSIADTQFLGRWSNQKTCRIYVCEGEKAIANLVRTAFQQRQVSSFRDYFASFCARYLAGKGA